VLLTLSGSRGAGQVAPLRARSGSALRGL